MSKRQHYHEEQICAQMIRELTNLIPMYPELKWLFHIDNEGRRRPWIAKRKGIKKGVSDYMLPVAKGGYNGVFFEMKARGKKVKVGSEQDKFLKFAKYNGYYVFESDNAAVAVSNVLKYLSGQIVR